MLALQRYEKMPVNRSPADIKREIAALEQELPAPDSRARPRAALQKNLELKREAARVLCLGGRDDQALSRSWIRWRRCSSAVQPELDLAARSAAIAESSTPSCGSEASDRAVSRD